MIYTIMRMDYVQTEDGIPFILLWTRDENLKLKVWNFKFTPYFYVEGKGPFKSYITNKSLKMIGVKLKPTEILSQKMEELRKQYNRTYESHIFLTRRFLIDTKIKGLFAIENKKLYPIDLLQTPNIKPAPPRTLYLDIETNTPPTEWSDVKKPFYEITALSFWDSYEKVLHGFIWHPTLHVTAYKKVAKVETKYGTERFKVVIHQFRSERALLEAFVSYVRKLDPDLITGWFSSGYFDPSRHKWIKGFDIPYLIERMRVLKLNPNKLSPLNSTYITKDRAVIRGRVLLDLLPFFIELQKPISELPSWTLGYVAEYVCGIKSYERKPFVSALWKKAPLKLLQHNILDVIKTVLVDKYAKVIDHFNWRRLVSGCEWGDLLLHSRVVHILALREARGNYVLPDKLETEKVESFKGAYVKRPILGVHEWVVNLDFKMFYPSIIRSFNLSPETLIKNGKDITVVLIKGGRERPQTVSFKKEPRGLFPRILDNFVKAREQTKAKLKKAKNQEEQHLYWMLDRSFKFFINSIYGVLGAKSFALYNPYVSAAVTAIGREILQFIEREIERRGYKCLFADTDGLYVLLPKVNSKQECVQMGKKLEEELNQATTTYLKEKYGVKGIELEFSKAFKSILFRKLSKAEEAAKKGYAGLKFWEGREIKETIEVKGFESKKSTSSAFGKEVQAKVIEMILKSKSKDEIVGFIRQKVQEIRKQPLTKIAIPRSINKPLVSYPRKPAVVRGALYVNKYFSANIGATKVLYLYVRGIKEYPPTDVIAWDEDSYSLLPIDKIIVDYPKMIEKTLKNKLEPYLEAIGINWKKMRLPINRQKYRRKNKISKGKQRVLDAYVSG